MEYTLRIEGLAQLDSFAAGLVAFLRPGDVIALRGAVGAGKTTLVRALVRYLHGSDEATSPSFTFWQRYDGALPINHLDLYRLESPQELTELGLEEAFDQQSCTIVEWPEQAPSLIPSHALQIDITGAGDEARTVRIWNAQARRAS